MSSKYKPLLFNTTMRSPERLKRFLAALKEFDGQVLDNSLIQAICIKLIKTGLYQPTRVSAEVKSLWKSEIELTDVQATEVFENNPQEHTEAGFERGWPSRFDTQFKLAKELGFVWYWPNERIAFSRTGDMLIDFDHPENEIIVFANAFAKFNRDNPFRSALNSNIPLVLLIETIQLFNSDPDYNGAGISRREIPILLCWHNNDARALYEYIKVLRQKYGFTPSDEVILEVCQGLNDTTKRSDASLLTDYPDDFIRKMRLTSLITVRGGGRFVDTNKKEQEVISYILQKYSYVDPAHQESQRVFFDYISRLDESLASKLTVATSPAQSDTHELRKWVTYFGWETISHELLALAQKKKSADPVLQIIDQPLRLEFLTSLAIVSQLPENIVKPNYISDDEGLPVSFAGGGYADIECHENGRLVLVEVTLLKGVQQHIRESFSVKRHLQEYIKDHPNAFSLLLSPETFSDTLGHAEYERSKGGVDVRPIDIPMFIESLAENTSLSRFRH